LDRLIICNFNNLSSLSKIIIYHLCVEKRCIIIIIFLIRNAPFSCEMILIWNVWLFSMHCFKLSDFEFDTEINSNEITSVAWIIGTCWYFRASCSISIVTTRTFSTPVASFCVLTRDAGKTRIFPTRCNLSSWDDLNWTVMRMLLVEFTLFIKTRSQYAKL
jgi:hypothetical protein